LSADAEQEAAVRLLEHPADETGEQLTTNLLQQLQLQTSFDEFFLYNIQGRILVSTSAIQVGRRVVSQPYFEPSLSTPYLQFPFYEVAQGALSMVITRPIVGPTGKTLGVLAGHLRMNELSAVMEERSGLGETGETYLVSAQSNYLITASRFQDTPMTRAYHSQGIDSALAKQDGYGVYTDYRGQAVIGVYRWLPELRAGLLAEMNEDEATIALSRVQQLSLLATVIAIAAAVGIGVGASSWISRPIVRLKAVAQAVAAGDFTRQVSISRHDEIGELATAFNVMTERLVDNIDMLNQTVEEVSRVYRELETTTQQLSQSNAALQQQITERQVIEENLRQSLAKEKELNELKVRFTSMMSHEFRTPLAVIQASADILKNYHDRLTPERTIEHITTIQQQIKRLIDLLGDVLSLSKAQSVGLELNPVPLDMEAFCREIVNQIQMTAPNHIITLSCHGRAEAVRLDEKLMREATSNLLSNAVKYSPRGGKVDLRVIYQGKQLILEIQDQGIGIPEGDLAHLFEPFHRGENVGTISGTGLGLAITKQAVEAHGGTIAVESHLGLGTTFILSLPMNG
jgi:signal transduction histidine kinase/HAMP domain-containing protein